MHVAAVCIFILCASAVSYQNWDANVCGGYALVPLINKYLCGWFSNLWILVTISGMGGVVIKGMGAVAQVWIIPEA